MTEELQQEVFNELMSIIVWQDGYTEYLRMSDHDVAVDLANNQEDFEEHSTEQLVELVTNWRKSV